MHGIDGLEGSWRKVKMRVNLSTFHFLLPRCLFNSFCICLWYVLADLSTFIQSVKGLGLNFSDPLSLCLMLKQKAAHLSKSFLSFSHFLHSELYRTRKICQPSEQGVTLIPDKTKAAASHFSHDCKVVSQICP